jgi:hypothetical protein
LQVLLVLLLILVLVSCSLCFERGAIVSLLLLLR